MDVQCTGLQFTWNQKSKGRDGVLKKLDRILANLEFYDGFVGAHANFKPYRISDHSPAVLNIPTNVKAIRVSGFYMFQVVQNLKALKKPLRKLLYDKGNLHTNVSRLRADLDRVQSALDSDPFNAIPTQPIFIKQLRVVLAGAELMWLTVDDALNTVWVISDQEVKEAMFSMGNDKSSGPNGYTAAFFKEAWDTVRSDVTYAVREFFVNGRLLKEINHIIIALIPKVILKGFGFHDRVVAWIMECVATTSFSISINGSLHGHFKGKKGLRQGDPLSPYLFALVMEVLTLMLQRRVQDSNHFTYHRYFSKLDLINVCFADDLFLFSHGDVNSVMVIKEALDEFQCASGLIPSLPESTAYFCNILNFTKLAILQILPFEEGRLPVKYLGVPLVSSRLILGIARSLLKRWCPNGPLSTIVSTHDMFCGSFTLLSTVRDAIRNGSWLWPQEWTVKYRLLNNISVLVLVAGKRDCLEWRDGAGASAGQQVLVQVWSHLTRYAGMRSAGLSMQSIISYLIYLAKRKTTRSVIGKIVVAATAYFVWHDCNRRLFKGNKRLVQEIIKCTISSIRLKLLSCLFKKSNDGVLFARLWDLLK
uniref:Putative RNA-directed DNA polymerase, eukaryota, reverse transcriptase zinc-binding domain protein n=1 Tax=Tanacetum cinerariifolium TaxID=118510 RepID=A0A6L2JSZ7_TANCI|nr:putative RNA-directed DNA polymerase, eukaryota, reverse transcriptase zinc-binding domain protein [Tanacetum cinerariifolium]